MNPNHHPLPLTFVPLIFLLLVTGCADDSARIAGVAHHAIESQTQQNEELARLSGEVVASSRDLVAQDAIARNQILEAQQNLQGQQTDLGLQRDDLEQERRRLAAQRRFESLLAPIVSVLGNTFLCLLPVAVAGYALLLSQNSVPEMAAVGEILLNEMVAESPRLLPLTQPSAHRRLEPPPAPSSV